MKPGNAVFILGIHFFLLSLLSFGGANSVIPEMHRLIVYEYQWMSEQQFTDLFAISRAAPGPNVLIATLLGWCVAHVWGAVVATVAICIPSCILTYGIGRLWNHFSHNRWLLITKEGFLPVVLGSITAVVLILIQVADHSLSAFLLTATTAIVSYKTQIHPLWLLGGAMILGLLGWV